MLDLIGTPYVASVEFAFLSHMSENGVCMQNPRTVAQMQLLSYSVELLTGSLLF